MPRFLLALLALAFCQAGAADEFAAKVAALNGKNFAQKAAAIDSLAETDHPRVMTILEAMLNGRLYTRKDKRIVIAEPLDRELALTDAVSGERLASVGKREVRRISINNTLRSSLRSALARSRLSHADPQTRLAAVREILDNFEADSAAILQRAAAEERHPQVREAMQVGLALGGLNHPEAAQRIDAIKTLAGNLNPQVRNRLNALLESEPDEAARAAVAQALAAIDSKRRFSAIAETVFFGLSLGSVLFLAAVGLAITFGVMGVINMAHGELIMLGAYTTYLIQLVVPIDWSLLAAIPAAFAVSGLFGVAIERGVIRFLYGRPLETLLATFGLSLILQQLVRTTFSAQNVPVANPSWMSGYWQINQVLSLTYNRLFILVFALLVFALLMFVLKKTALGLNVRAVSQNRDMGKVMGIRTDWVDAMTFGLGAGIAGVAGVALSQLTNVGPNLGQSYIVDSFMVVVFGGVGNLWGTLLGALTLGVVNKFLEPFAGAVLAKVLMLVLIILFIQKRPRGLFPQKGRAAEG